MLQVRRFFRNEILFDELEEVSEAYFLNEGTIDVGYMLNNVKFYKFRLTFPFMINMMNLVAKIRSHFVYRSSSTVKCFAINRRNWS